MDRILKILKKENGPSASSAPALELNTIIFKHVYWYMQLISGERLQDHWSSGSVDQKIFIPLFRRRLIDNFLVELRVGLNTYSSMTLYRELKDDFHLAEYLKTLDNKKHRNAISKLRMSSHRLAIEKGRHNDIARQNRKCIFCTTNDIEDEYHFVLICPRYQTSRLQHIKRYYRTNPSMLKFIQLLNSTGKTLKNLAVYISKAFEERNLLVNDVYE